jgi:hypothetical protein
MYMRKILGVTVIVFLLLASFAVLEKPVSASSAVENSWVTRASMPTARGGLGVAVVDGKIFAIGGATSWSSGFLGTNEMYDPVADKWVSKAPMPTPRAYFAIAAYGGKIYCIGGQIGVEQEPAADYLWGPKMTSVNEVYDVATDTWSKAASWAGGMYISAEAVGGLILVNSGYKWAYNTTDNSWSNSTAMPFSSWYQLGNPITYLQVNVNNKTFKTSVQDGGAVETSGVNSSIRAYVVGSDVNQIYDPNTGNKIGGAVMPTSRGHFGLAIVNDVIYAIGGFKSGANEAYFPIGYGTPDPVYVLEHYPPKIQFMSQANLTYKNSTVPLLFSVDKAVSWMGYGIDGQPTVTIDGNATIANITNGAHTLTVYANDTYGNYAVPQTLNFTVAVPEPFPTLIFVAITAVLATVIAAVSIAVYKKYRT